MPKATTTNALPKRKIAPTASSVCDWQDNTTHGSGKRQRQASLVNFFGQPTPTTTKRPALVSPDQKNNPALLAVSVNTNTASYKQKKSTLLQGGKKSQQQLCIDVGQASLVQRTECVHCGTLYLPAVAQDVEAHERVCRNFTQGVFIKMSLALQGSKEVVKLKAKDSFIIEIKSTNTNTSLRRKVQDVQQIAEQELGFVQSDNDDNGDSATNKRTRQSLPFHSFLYVVQQRIVALLMTETISQAFLSSENGQSMTCLQHPRKANLGIRLLWVKASHRSTGIATKLVDVARERLVFGYTSIPARQVAFSSPTESGLGFARAYMKRHGVPLLVYQYAATTSHEKEEDERVGDV